MDLVILSSTQHPLTGDQSFFATLATLATLQKKQYQRLTRRRNPHEFLNYLLNSPTTKLGPQSLAVDFATIGSPVLATVGVISNHDND